MFEGPLYTASLSLVGTLAVYYCAAIVRNLYFHPLQHFPGPKLAAATWWYTTWFEVFRNGGMVDHLQTLHKRYGPIVRIAPNELHFNGPQFYADIYVNGSKFRKDPKLYTTFHEDESSFCFIDPQDAKIRREIMNPLFSRRAILQLEQYVQATIDKFLEKLQSSRKAIDLHRACRCATLEIILSYCFAGEYDILGAPDFAHPLIIAVENVMPLALVFKHFPFAYDALLWLDSQFKRFRQDSFGPGELMESLSQQIDELLVHPELLQQQDHDTIYHHLLTPNPTKGQLAIPSKKSLLEEAMNLVAAGSDTVGNTSTVGTYYILSNPDVFVKLSNELKQHWPDPTIPLKYETLEKLPYLTAVIKESLRMSHGIVTPLPRIVAPADATIGGVAVPAGTVVGVGATFIHYNPELFPEPHKFSPERWLNSRASDTHLVSFSKGPRSCLGINLAWCELYLLFANMFRKLDLELYNTKPEDLKFQCHLTPTFRKHVEVTVKQAAP
ncbi:cytochrome P450 family protein [Pleurotus pulmonarius]